MTGAGSLAWSLCVTSTRLAGEDLVAGRVLHVTGHSDNFRLQQALVLVKVYSETQSQTTVLPSQVLYIYSIPSKISTVFWCHFLFSMPYSHLPCSLESSIRVLCWCVCLLSSCVFGFRV